MFEQESQDEYLFLIGAGILLGIMLFFVRGVLPLRAPLNEMIPTLCVCGRPRFDDLHRFLHKKLHRTVTNFRMRQDKAFENYLKPGWSERWGLFVQWGLLRYFSCA